MKVNLIIIMTLLLLSSCKEKYCLLIGENILLDNNDFTNILSSELNTNINNDFLTNQSTISDVYNFINKKAINLKTSSSVESLLKDADKIIYHVGNYEVSRHVKIQEDKVFYDQEIICNSLEVFEYYVHLTFEEISTYNKNVLLIPIFIDKYLIDEEKKIYLDVIEKYNNIIYSKAKEFNFAYLDINNIDKFINNNGELTYSGTRYLVDKIKDYYGFN